MFDNIFNFQELWISSYLIFYVQLTTSRWKSAPHDQQTQ